MWSVAAIGRRRGPINVVGDRFARHGPKRKTWPGEARRPAVG